jgi:hypothetical protein
MITSKNLQAGRDVWRLQADNAFKIMAARKESARIKALKYRNENISERRLKERDWHRKKAGIPLDLPNFKPWGYSKSKPV